MSKELRKSNLIAKGVVNLQKFGYPEVNSKNILTDYVYSHFFKNMLIESLDYSSGEIKEVIQSLLADINQNSKEKNDTNVAAYL